VHGQGRGPCLCGAASVQNSFGRGGSLHLLAILDDILSDGGSRRGVLPASLDGISMLHLVISLFFVSNQDRTMQTPGLPQNKQLRHLNVQTTGKTAKDFLCWMQDGS